MFRFFKRCLRKNRAREDESTDTLLNKDDKLFCSDESSNRAEGKKDIPYKGKLVIRIGSSDEKPGSSSEDKKADFRGKKLAYADENLDIIKRTRAKYPVQYHIHSNLDKKTFLRNAACFVVGAGTFAGTVYGFVQKVRYMNHITDRYYDDTIWLNSSYPNMTCNAVFGPYNVRLNDFCYNNVKDLNGTVASSAIEACYSLIHNGCPDAIFWFLLSFSAIMGLSVFVGTTCSIASIDCDIDRKISPEEKHFRHHIGIPITPFNASERDYEEHIRREARSIQALNFLNRIQAPLSIIDEYLTDPNTGVIAEKKDKAACQFIRLSMHDDDFRKRHVPRQVNMVDRHLIKPSSPQQHNMENTVLEEADSSRSRRPGQ